MDRNGLVGLQLWLRHRAALAAALCLSFLGACGGAPPAQQIDHAQALAFEPNRGQSDEQVRFIARGGGYTAFMTATEAVLVPRHGRRDGDADEAPAVRMKLIGANPAPVIAAEDELPGKVHYVAGSEPAAELTDIPTYGTLRYTAVYPGIDVVYYGNGDRLEYDFVVGVGADPQAIAIGFDGAKTIEIDGVDGALRVQSSAGEFRQPAPVVYQQREHGREPVAARWEHAGAQRVGIRVGAYDTSLPLVIDPLLLYSSYLGGRGDDAGNGIAVDALGNIYVAGATTSPNFPGAPPRTSTASAAFVTKLGANGQRLYSTILLDTDNRGATGIAVDRTGNAYVTGRTSLSRPVAGDDVFVAKLDAAGRSAAPSGYFYTFGGDHVDWGHRIAVDAAGHAYVVGQTLSSSFLTTPGALQNTHAGESDGFVAKLNASGTALVYATLLGGSDADSVHNIALDAYGNAYLTGSTKSIDFPVTAYGWQRQHRGCSSDSGYVMCAQTAFAAKLNPAGSALVYSTYLGGSGYDQQSVGEGIAVDAYGRAYVTGSTTADNFPTTAGVVQPRAGNRLCFHEVCTDTFVTKLNAGGSAPMYSTYLFGEAQDDGVAIAVDAAGNAYIAGSTVSNYFPIVDAFQPKRGSFQDAFVAKLNSNASRLLHASYLGGSGDDTSQRWSAASAIAIDASGNAYLTGQTYTTDFPTTPGAMQRTPGGGSGCGGVIFLCGDAFVTKVAATGPGVAQAITVGMTSTRAVLGATIEAAWTGIPAPDAYDRVGLYQLGHSDEQFEVWGGWATTGAASGTTTLALPATLEPGWYELRLWSGDYSQFTPLARSKPFQLFRY